MSLDRRAITNSSSVQVNEPSLPCPLLKSEVPCVSPPPPKKRPLEQLERWFCGGWTPNRNRRRTLRNPSKGGETPTPPAPPMCWTLLGPGHEPQRGDLAVLSRGEPRGERREAGRRRRGVARGCCPSARLQRLEKEVSEGARGGGGGREGAARGCHRRRGGDRSRGDLPHPALGPRDSHAGPAPLGLLPPRGQPAAGREREADNFLLPARNPEATSKLRAGPLA